MATPRDGREENPLGLGPRDREGSNTGSTADTSYDAVGSDPYRTGEPAKDFSGIESLKGQDRGRQQGASTPADPETPSSDEP